MMGVPPSDLPPANENVSGDLQALDHWVPWRWEFRDGKWTKIPIDAASGRHAKSTDPRTWSPFEKAVRYSRKRHLPGVGFVFTSSPFAGVDLDGCRDPDTGRLEEWAREIVAELDSYTEVSPSAAGVKVFVRGALPPGRRRKGPIEMYDSGRFFTVTGHRLPGTPGVVMERTRQLASFHHRVFGDAPNVTGRRTQSRLLASTGGAALDDAELVMRTRSAANGEKFARLWSGDTGGYADGGNEGRSEADLALCSLLAFWTGPDEARIAWLFRESGLYRPKWEREDYRARTLKAALNGRGEFWAPRTRLRRRRGTISTTPPEAAAARERVVRVG
jgi:putative DNA primase/helicase